MDAKDKELAALLLNKFINADSDTEKNYYMTVLYKLYRKDIVRYAKSLVHYLTTLDIYDIEQETSLTFIETWLCCILYILHQIHYQKWMSCVFLLPFFLF